MPDVTVTIEQTTVRPPGSLAVRVATGAGGFGRPVVIDVEAWRDGERVAQAFGVATDGAFDRELALDVPATAEPGTWQVGAFVFAAPAARGEPWGEVLWQDPRAGTVLVTRTGRYVSTAPNAAGYARLPQQVDDYALRYPELRAIADQPQAVWAGMEWAPDAAAWGREVAVAAGDLPALVVVYAIPDRDAGQYSRGGAPTAEAYRSWVRALARGVGDHPPIYVLEPDALGHLDRLDPARQRERLRLLADAARVLRRGAGARVYLDASMWVPPPEMAARIGSLTPAGDGAGLVDGFTLNVSNYKRLDVCRGYGGALSALTGLPYLVDTSRNGVGTTADDGRWCNVPGQAIGERPDLARGFVWVKAPGESDGPEPRHAPPAGAFWVEGALALTRNQPPGR